jgi:hypothetical protein
MPPGSLFQSIERDIRPKAQRSEQRQQGRRFEPKSDYEAICGGCSFQVCRFLRHPVQLLKAQAKLIADTDGGSKGAGLHLSQASRDQACDWRFTHYKKRFTLYIYYSTFEKAAFMPEFQRSASGL